MTRSKRLAVRVEVWHRRSQSMSSDIADRINDNYKNMWNGLGAGKRGGEFPWALYLRVSETEQDADAVTVEIEFQHRNIRDVNKFTDEEKLNELHKLCNILLDKSGGKFAPVGDGDFEQGALNWKPSSQAPLSWANMRFGNVFSVRLLTEIKSEKLFKVSANGNSMFRGPVESIMFMSDIREWFAPHISQLQDLLPPTGLTHSAERTLLYILKSCVTTAKWTDISVIQVPASNQLQHTEQNTLQRELARIKGLASIKEAGDRATDSLSDLIDSTDIQNISTGRLAETIQKLTTSIEHARQAYDTSNDFARSERNQVIMGGVGTAAGAGVCIAGAKLCSAGTFGLGIPGVVFGSLLALFCEKEARAAWKEWENWNNLSQAFFDVGFYSHQVWLFMMLYHMRQSGLITDNDEAFLQFANQMANTFSGINVKEKWGDVEYVKTWLERRTAVITEALEKIRVS